MACRSATFRLLAAILLAGAVFAQSRQDRVLAQEKDAPAALVRSVQAVPGPQGVAIEILATRPLTPNLMVLENPLRLVVDLPKSYITSQRKVSYRDEKVSGIRLNQFQSDPPVVRLVVDLLKPTTYTWDGAGNRLMIRLYPGNQPAPAAAVPAFTQGIAPANSGLSVSGAVVPTGQPSAAGSSVTAGSDTAILHMARGGEIRVCPGTTISVTSSKNGREVMLGMSTGALEAHYQLETSADSVLTPDFRILLAGPGEFHYAISADSRGNTCVRTLPGNTASVVVAELMGDGTYQVKPSEEVVFREGHLRTTDSNIPADCGCAMQRVPVLRAAAPSDETRTGIPGGTSSPTVATSPVTPSEPETASLPASTRNEPHIQVDAPFVFRATDQPPPPPTVPGDQLPLARARKAEVLEATALPPSSLPTMPSTAAHNSKPGFFGRVKGFFSALFR